MSPDLAAIALAMMTSLVPPALHRPPPGWTETPEAIGARYRAIAADIGAVARNRTEVAYLVGVAAHESSFYADADGMKCYRGPGWEQRCDGGRAWTIFQMQSADPEQIARWKDRRVAARDALRRIIGSMRACAGNAPGQRLAMYASGSCARGLETAQGLAASVQHALRIAVPPET